jgi:hypothetical protein
MMIKNRLDLSGMRVAIFVLRFGMKSARFTKNVKLIFEAPPARI